MKKEKRIRPNYRNWVVIKHRGKFVNEYAGVVNWVEDIEDASILHSVKSATINANNNGLIGYEIIPRFTSKEIKDLTS